MRLCKKEFETGILLYRLVEAMNSLMVSPLF